MEGMLTQIMYDIPSDPTVVKAVITKECVEGTAEPELTHDPNKINYSVKLNTGKGERARQRLFHSRVGVLNDKTGEGAFLRPLSV